MSRIYSFNAGPAVLPLEVLEQAQAELVDFKGTGMSILEHSHRGKEYEAVHNEAVDNIKKLLGLGDNYAALFLQGGASQQFAMVPMNLLGEGQSADYVNSGAWGSKAIKEAKIIGKVNVIARLGEGHSDEAAGRFQPEVHAGRGLRSHHLERDDRRHTVEDVSEDRRPAGGGHVVGHAVAAVRSEPVRPDLRRRPEEPWPGRRHAGDHPQGLGREGCRKSSYDLPLQDAHRGKLALQHSAVLRDLHGDAGYTLAD